MYASIDDLCDRWGLKKLLLLLLVKLDNRLRRDVIDSSTVFVSWSDYLDINSLLHCLTLVDKIFRFVLVFGILINQITKVEHFHQTLDPNIIMRIDQRCFLDDKDIRSSVLTAHNIVKRLSQFDVDFLFSV